MFLVALDRDGTINKDVNYLGNQSYWMWQIEFLENAIEGVKKLTSKDNFKVVVITNQAGVARGFFNCKRVEEVNRTLDDRLKNEGVHLDGWYYCPFVDEKYARARDIPLDSEWVKETDLRKPGTGMLEEAVSDLELMDSRVRKLEDFKEIYVVGDKITDALTGLYANGKGGLISDDVKKYEEWASKFSPDKTFCAKDLSEAADIILEDSAKIE